MMKKTKKILSMMLTVVIIFLCVHIVPCYAQNFGVCGDNATWTLENGVLTISGTGDMYDWTNDAPSPFFGLTGIETINIQNGITSVGNYAFKNNKSVVTVNFADSVETIGNSAFYSCAALEYINWGSGIKSIGMDAFGNVNISSLAMPDSIEFVGESAFFGCASLEKIYVSSGLKTIPENCFCNCENLMYLVVPEGVERIEWGAFSDHEIMELFIPKSLTYLDSEAFYGRYDMDAVYYGGTQEQFINLINDPYISGAYEIMYMCDIDNSYGYDLLSDGTVKLTFCFAARPHLEIPETIDGYVVSELGNNLYRNKIIVSAKIPSTIKRIGDNAFGHTDIKQITIPSSVEYIGESAFGGTKYLQNIVLDGENKNYSVIDGNLYTKDMSKMISYCNGKENKKYEILDGVKIIGSGCFELNSKLCEVIIPDSVEEIGDEAFFKVNLKSIDIPASVNYIGEDNFFRCDKLEAINVDDNNPFYMDDDGVLTDKQNLCLIRYPDGKKDSAYRIPDGIVEIGEYCFFRNSSLRALLVPESVVYVCRYAMYASEPLKRMYYQGTQEQFYSIDGYNNLRGYYDIEFEYDINTVTSISDIMFYQYQNDVTCEVNLQYSMQDIVVFMAFYDDEDKLVHVEFVPTQKDVLSILKEFETGKQLTGNKCSVYVFSDTASVKPLTKPVISDVRAVENTDIVLETVHPLAGAQRLEYIHPEECQGIIIAFSADTEVHADNECVIIYGARDNVIGEYYGNELAGKVVKIPGGYVEIYVRGRRDSVKYGVKTDYIRVIK